MGRGGGIFRVPRIVPVRTALRFPAPSGLALDGVSFLWNPITFLAQTPATLIWRVKYQSHAYYYTNGFYMNNFGGEFVDDHGYWAAQPFPEPAPNGERVWEISTDFDDFTGGTVEYNRWYVQSLRIGGSLLRPSFEYYYDLEYNPTSKLTQTNAHDWVQTASPVLIFGDNGWTNTNSESLHGDLRGLQIYNDQLSVANLITEAANQDINGAQTAAGQAALKYINQNPTPSDISDKSGNGNHPDWLNSSNKATLVLV